MQYTIIRSRRRTVALIIDRRGNLVVRAPKFADLGEIERFVAQKDRWIKKHLQAAAENRRLQKQYTEGENFLFLGREYPLRISDGHSRVLKFDRQAFLLPRSESLRPKQLFIDWYRLQAKFLLKQRADFWQSKMAVVYKKISITGAGTRWGSCSRKGSINFSWRLVLAPLEVIDYVVVHELAHLAHHNHSQKFWDLTGFYAPNYKQAKKWLNTHGHFLVL